MSLGNKILYLFSSRSVISMRRLKRDLADLLGKDDPDNFDFFVWRTLRNFRALGHIEANVVNREEKFISTNPAIVRLPLVGPVECVLTGSRFPETIEKLMSSANKDIEIKTEENRPEKSVAPDTITIISDTSDKIAALAEEHEIEFIDGYPAFDLANFASSCSDIINSDEWRERDLSGFQSYFDIENYKFKKGSEDSNPALKEHFNELDHRRTYYIFNDEGESVPIDKDYGRYAFLSLKEENCLDYIPESYELKAPLSLPFPPLLERSLTLCSGKCPRLNTEGTHYIYSEIPREIGKIVINKLSGEF